MEYDESPAGRLRRARGLPPEPTVIEGVGHYIPETAADLAERRDAFLRFHQAHGTIDGTGALTAYGEQVVNAYAQYSANRLASTADNWIVCTDDEARELARRMAIDATAVQVGNSAEVTGPADTARRYSRAMAKLDDPDPMRPLRGIA